MMYYYSTSTYVVQRKADLDILLLHSYIYVFFKKIVRVGPIKVKLSDQNAHVPASRKCSLVSKGYK